MTIFDMRESRPPKKNAKKIVKKSVIFTCMDYHTETQLIRKAA